MTLFDGQNYLALELFLSSAPRYRVAVLADTAHINGENVLNMGRELATVISTIDRHNELKFQFTVQEAVNRIIQEHTFTEPNLGEVVIIANPGILFEPELHIDVPELLRRISRNTLVILLWPGEITKDKLSFMRPSSPYCIHQSETNYIVI